MKKFNAHSRARRSSTSQRAQLLTAFDRSGLTAAAFARKHQLNYTTFCGWRQRRSQTAAVPGFVQVELPAPAAANVLIVELVGGARMRIESADQIVLAAALVHQLHTSGLC
jgi:hypothetical protein